MKLPCSLLLTATLTACATSTQAPPPEPTREIDRMVDRVIQAYGGAQAVERLGTSRIVGSVTPHIRDLGGAGRVQRDFAAPDRLRVEIAYPAQTELRILNGQRGWRGNAPRITAVQGPPLVAMRYQLLRLQPAWALGAHRDLLSLGETREVDGAPRRTLRLTWSPELSLDYLVDEATWRITRVEAQLSFGAMALQFATDYSEFQMVKGALIPLAELNYASGRHTASTRILSVELGVGDLGPFTGPR